MTIATLSEVLTKAKENKYAVAGLVVLGWEDARCYAETADELNLPIILQAGPGCRANTPVSILGKMFRHLAEQSSNPVVCHLDHGYTKEECIEGIDSGFTSVMFDGSKLPLSENIEKTNEIVEIAHQSNVSVEGEIGFVGYDNGKISEGTNIEDAVSFANKSNIDAMAISVGNTHLQTSKKASIDFNKINLIEAKTKIPLVLHGSSGIPVEQRKKLARKTKVAKLNIGTEIRMTFGKALRKNLKNNLKTYDRLQLLKPTIKDLTKVTKKIIKQIGPN